MKKMVLVVFLFICAAFAPHIVHAQSPCFVPIDNNASILEPGFTLYPGVPAAIPACMGVTACQVPLNATQVTVYPGALVVRKMNTALPACTAAQTGGTTAALSQSSVLSVLGVASDAQTGAMSMQDHTALAGISPVGKETAPGDRTGLHNIFANTTYCPLYGVTIGCAAYVPPNYTYNAVGNGYSQYGWLNAGMQGRGQSILDRTKGQFRILSNNPMPGADNQAVDVIDIEGAWQYGDGGSHQGLNIYYLDSGAGVNNGPVGQFGAVNAQSGWSFHAGTNMTMISASQGITQVEGFTATKSSPGDFNIYKYLTSYGGWRTLADEGAQMDAGKIREATTQYKGRPTSKVNDYVITSAIIGGSIDIGEGMRAVDMTPSSTIFSGYVTSHSAFGDIGDANGGGVYELLGITGGTVTPSKYCITLDAPIDVPTIGSTNDPATGLMNTVTTNVTFAATIGASANCGPGTSTPAAGDYINLGQPFWEVVKIASVNSPSTGHYNITAPVSLFHRAGQNVWETSYGGAGIAFTANTATTANNSNTSIPDSAGIPYFNEIVGYPDSTHVVAVRYLQGHLDTMEQNNGFGNVSFAQIGLDSLTNSAGVVTLYFYIGGGVDPRIYSYPIVTISNAVNTAFNGQCLNVRNYRYASQGKYAIDCDESASSNQTQGYNSQTPILTFGTSPYGNTQAVIYPMAKILDVNTYPAYPGCYGSTGSGCVPYVGGAFRLGPNKMPLPTDGTGILLAAHDNAMSIDYHDNDMQLYNPTALGHMANLTMGGSGMNQNFTGITIANTTANANHIGYRGDQSIPRSALAIGGLFNQQIYAAIAPARFGSAHFIGCPASGCADTTSFYDIFTSQNVGGFASVQAQPGVNAVHFNGATWDFASQARFQGIPQYAVGAAIASSASPFAPNYQITHVTGTSPIGTITPPSSCTANTAATALAQNGTNYGCQITLIPDAIFTTTTAGNIALASTAIVNRALLMTFDPGTNKWYPSY